MGDENPSGEPDHWGGGGGGGGGGGRGGGEKQYSCSLYTNLLKKP